MGVYDILNPDFNPATFKPSSTEPIVKVQGMNNEIASSSDEGDDSSDSDHLYYEFNSSDGDQIS